MALKSDGTARALGSNAFGQLGDGTTIDRLVPVQVSGLGVSITATVTFYQNGVGTDFTGTVLTIDGTTNLGVNDLPKTFTWDIGSTHTYACASPLDKGLGKQYVLTSTTSGGSPTTQSGTITALIWGGTYTGNYGTSIVGDTSGSEGVPDGVVDVYDLQALGENYGKGGRKHNVQDTARLCAHALD